VLHGPRADRALGTSCASWKARASLSSSGSLRSNRAHRLSEFRKVCGSQPYRVKFGEKVCGRIQGCWRCGGWRSLCTLA
jgi:hypothetical protein